MNGDRALDERLRRAFAPPDDLARRLRLPRSGRGARRRVLLAAAAAIAVLGLGWWGVSRRPAPTPIDIAPLFASLVEHVAEPPCSNERELAEVLRRDHGVVFAPRVGPDALQGPYAFADWPGAVFLVEGTGADLVCVVLDQARYHRRPVVPPDSALEVRERTLGDLVVWEVSRLSAPRCLRLFSRS